MTSPTLSLPDRLGSAAASPVQGDLVLVCADVELRSPESDRAFIEAVRADGWYRCRSGQRSFVQVLLQVRARDAAAAGPLAAARCRAALAAVGLPGTVSAVRAEDGLLPGGDEPRRARCVECVEPSEVPCAACDEEAVLSRHEALASGAGALVYADLGATSGLLREVF